MVTPPHPKRQYAGRATVVYFQDAQFTRHQFQHQRDVHADLADDDGCDCPMLGRAFLKLVGLGAISFGERPRVGIAQVAILRTFAQPKFDSPHVAGKAPAVELHRPASTIHVFTTEVFVNPAH